MPRTMLDAMREGRIDLPTIPESLTRILRIIEDNNSGAADLADAIRVDPPLAAKILRLANSPLYTQTRAIGTIRECVAVLGYRTVRQVALCVAVVSTLARECAQRQAAVAYRDLWRHGVAAGAVARVLARQTGCDDAEEVFTCGLLHDLGKFVLTLQHPQRYAEVIRDRRRQGIPLVEAERDAFGYDHAGAGAALAEHWRFPSQLVGAIAHHHDSPPDDRDATIVQLADLLAHRLDPSSADLGFEARLVDAVQLHHRLGLDEGAVNGQSQELRAAIAALSPLRQID